MMNNLFAFFYKLYLMCRGYKFSKPARGKKRNSGKIIITDEFRDFAYKAHGVRVK